MHQNVSISLRLSDSVPVPRFKLSSFSHFVTTAFSYPKLELTALRGRQQKCRKETREGFLRKNIVAVSFFQKCAIHQYS